MLLQENLLYYDIGVNLFSPQFHDPEQVIADAEADGVFCILTGTDPEENEKIDAFTRRHAVCGTAGFHPHNADHLKQGDAARIRELIRNNPRLLAVGECGLDYDRMFSTRENQIACLETMIALAEELDRPMFLHEREAAEDLIRCFQGHASICEKSVIHCFTGGREALEKYLDMGFHIGITGWICDDRRGTSLREAVKILPPDRVMVETDAPYLVPKNVKGLKRTNVPGNVKYVLRELAFRMDLDEAVLREQVRRNTERFFGIPAGMA